MIHAMKTSPIRSDWTGRNVDGLFPLLEWLGGTESTGVFRTELEGDRTQKAVVKLIAASAKDAEAQIDCWAATRSIAHPNLMPLLHCGRCQIDDAALLYAVMPYADEVLSDILAEWLLTPAETGEMLAPVMDALDYLHKNKMIHGRLKPANIMVTGDRLKISSDRLQTASERSDALPAPPSSTRPNSNPVRSPPPPTCGLSASP